MQSSRIDNWHIVRALSSLAIISLNFISLEMYSGITCKIGFSFVLSQLSQQKACVWKVIFLLTPELQREFPLQGSELGGREAAPKLPVPALTQNFPPC